MNALIQYKSALFVVGGLVVAFVAYVYFFPHSDDAVLTSEAVATPIENELVQLLLRLETVTLPDGVFGDPTFQSLEDFSQELVPEPQGRDNPFAPLSGSRSTSASAPRR